MSLPLAIAANVLLCVLLLGGLAYAMWQPNRLAPHVPAPIASDSCPERPTINVVRPAAARDTDAQHTLSEMTPA
jgi:hypothetical protein